MHGQQNVKKKKNLSNSDGMLNRKKQKPVLHLRKKNYYS